MNPLKWFKREPDIDLPGVTPAWLVRSVNAVAWVFVAILVQTVFLRSLDIARDKSVPLNITHAGWWIGNVNIWFPLFAPLVLAAIALPWTAKIIIPAFCAFDWADKRQRAPKVWCGLLTVMVALVTMTSGFPLYHDAYNQRFKAEAVRLEQVDLGRAQLEAAVQSTKDDLADLTGSRNAYQAQAATVGAKAWAKRIAEAEALNDPQLAMIRKAVGDAERGDELRKARADAQIALAAAPTKAAAAESIKGDHDYGTDAVMDFINAYWGFALFAVIELCALIAGWIAYMMEMVRTRQLADWQASQALDGEVDNTGLRITDQTNEWQPQPQDVTYDENGDELIPVRRKKEVYYRRKSSRKKDESQAPLSENDPRVQSVDEVETNHELGEISDNRGPVVGDGLLRGEQSFGPSDDGFSAVGDGDDLPADFEDTEIQSGPVSSADESELTHETAEAPEAEEPDESVQGAPAEELHPGAVESIEAESDSGFSYEQVDADSLQTSNEPITWDDEVEQAKFEQLEADGAQATPDPFTEEEYEALQRSNRGLNAPAEAAE